MRHRGLRALWTPQSLWLAFNRFLFKKQKERRNNFTTNHWYSSTRMVCCMCWARLALSSTVRVCVCVLNLRICLNVLLCFCICECFMTHPKLLKIPLDWIRYDFLFICSYTLPLFWYASPLNCSWEHLSVSRNAQLQVRVTCETCLWWRRYWKRAQTQTLLITILEIKLAAHWWMFHRHQYSENTSLIYLAVFFVLPLFAWSSIYIKPHLDGIILCTLSLSTYSMISLIRSLSFVPLLQIPQLQIFSYTGIS